jgi:SAM-dependent methyltransferase
MDRASKDPAARREWLKRWVAEQVEKERSDERQAQVPRRAIWPPPGWDRPRLSRVQDRFARASQRFVDRVCDRGLDTWRSTSEPEHEEDPDRVLYMASAWHVLPRALRYLGVSDHDTFVDFGCGKGRVVHQAARWPFRRVIGVEISPILAEIARTTVAARRRQHRCRNIEIVVSDVAEFTVPDDLTIGYLFHPFWNEAFDAFLGGILDSIDRQPRRVRLIYTHPLHGAKILDTGRFRLLRVQRTILLDTRYSQVAIFESV